MIAGAKVLGGDNTFAPAIMPTCLPEQLLQTGVGVKSLLIQARCTDFTPTPVCSNCSGKHVGMIAGAKVLGGDVADYHLG
jgi:L-asparaginase II